MTARTAQDTRGAPSAPRSSAAFGHASPVIPAITAVCPPDESPIRKMFSGSMQNFSAFARRNRTAVFASSICAGNGARVDSRYSTIAIRYPRAARPVSAGTLWKTSWRNQAEPCTNTMQG